MDEYSHLCGWASQYAEQAYQELAHRFTPFVCQGGLDKPGPPVWEFAKLVNGGQHLPAWNQETGDCVSMGAVQAGQYLSCYQIACQRREQRFQLWFPPYIYATSRVDIGRGQLGRGAGSTGAWAIEAMRKLGVLFKDDPGVPQYSGSLADSWGYRGAPAEMKALAKDNPISQASPIRDVDSLRTALINYNMVTYAISWVYGQGAVEHQGYRVLSRSGRSVGGHQVCLIAWMDEPFEAAYLLNSWSPRAHQGPDHGEPPGGAWILRKDLERDLSGSQTEVFAITSFLGTAAEPYYGLFGRG